MFLSISIIIFSINAQDFSRERELKKIFPKSYLKKIEKLDKLENRADILMVKVDGKYEQIYNLRLKADREKNYKKRKKVLKKAKSLEKSAIKERLSALEKYGDVSSQKYKLYEAHIKSLRKKLSDDKYKEIKIIKIQINKHIKEIEINRQKAYHIINEEDKFRTFTKAFKLEQIVLLKQMKIFALYLNWPKKEINKIDNELFAFVSNKPLSTDEVEPSEKKVILVDSTKIKKANDKKNEIVVKTVVKKVEKKIIIFKIQIAASKEPVSIENLERIYNAKGIINNELEDEWYKYSIGKFRTYEAAKKFKKTMGVSGAFITAYKNGKKVIISELVSKEQFKN